MGREVRMVSKDWEHPKSDRPNREYVPLHTGFNVSVAEWDKENNDWKCGIFPTYADEADRNLSYSEWGGSRPVQEDYMPEFENADYYMMYETCTEGTPISPAFKTQEELATWLCSTGASAFAGQSAGYEQWLNMIKAGLSVSAVFTGGKLVSGVEGGM